MKKWCRIMIAISLAAIFCSCDSANNGCGDTGDPPADTITVTGPITGGLGKPATASILDLGARGYIEEEFFFEGDATGYDLQGEMTLDGKWTLEASTREPFKSRILVRRPMDAGKFNGTVVMEWLNVTAGADGDPGFMYNWQEILRQGYAWVGVSAQVVGVEGGGIAIGEAVPLKTYDPERYGALNHPGDAYSYDIYTLATKVVRGAGKVDVLGGLTPKRLIAYGESQSAMRMISYVDGVHPLVNAFDGFFIHSRMAGGSPFSNVGLMIGVFAGRDPIQVRDDIDVPVFQFLTETDVAGGTGFHLARQLDSDRIRTWEVAGTAHADAYILSLNASVTGEDGASSSLDCQNVNDGPQHFVLKAALHSLNRWVSDGVAPPTAEPLTLDQDGKPMPDAHGNTLGGVRTPDVDVPIATLSGQAADADEGGCGGNMADMICFLFGSTTPFTPETLLALYPTHEDYVAKVTAAARQTREAGFMLAPEAQSMVAEAQAAPIPF